MFIAHHRRPGASPCLCGACVPSSCPVRPLSSCSASVVVCSLPFFWSGDRRLLGPGAASLDLREFGLRRHQLSVDITSRLSGDYRHSAPECGGATPSTSWPAQRTYYRSARCAPRAPPRLMRRVIAGLRLPYGEDVERDANRAPTLPLRACSTYPQLLLTPGMNS